MRRGTAFGVLLYLTAAAALGAGLPPGTVLAPGAMPAEPALDLVGVAITGDRRFALVRETGQALRRVEPGDLIGDWRVTAIEPGVIELQANGAVLRIDIASRSAPIFRTPDEPWLGTGGGAVAPR